MGKQSQYRPESLRPDIVTIMLAATSIKDLRTQLWAYMKAQNLDGYSYKKLSEEATQAVNDYSGPR